MFRTDDLRIETLKPLIPPAILMEEIPLDDAASTTVHDGRAAVSACMTGADDRLVVVVGPCSVHDVDGARDYARVLLREAERLRDDLVVVMRVYFEKPRTTVGWKGLINDPHLDGTFAINHGLRAARGLLRDLAQMGIPAGCEYLDTITPQFIADLVSWGAIGARTTESQVHRELASGLSMSVGFKNGTSGDVQVAVDAILAARQPHHFLSVTKQSVAAIVSTKGNDTCHVILRGGSDGPNYSPAHVAATKNLLRTAKLPEQVMIDCSHGNSGRNPEQQPAVAEAVGEQIAAGDHGISGVMIESHLLSGRQACPDCGRPLPGQSITDPCLGWEDTRPVLDRLAAAVRARRS